MSEQTPQQPAQVADVGTQEGKPLSVYEKVTQTERPPLEIPPEVKATEAKLAEEARKARELVNKYGTKSEAIRQLLAGGMKIGDVARALGVKYQHVHNVSKQPQKRKIKEAREAAAKAAVEAANNNTTNGEKH